MIYRVLVDEYDDGGSHDPETGRWVPLRALQGAGSCMGCTMDHYGLRMPEFDVPRARFYFTERGWEQVGRHVAADAREQGRVVKVIRRKNPERSQVVYRDALQVALLPRRERRER